MSTDINPPKSPLHLQVISTNIATGAVELSKVIDHNSHDDRIWLGRHCYWAFRNGRSITTYAVAG